MPLLRTFISKKIESARRRLASHKLEGRLGPETERLLGHIKRVFSEGRYDFYCVKSPHGITTEQGELKKGANYVENFRANGHEKSQRNAFEQIIGIVGQGAVSESRKNANPLRGTIEIQLTGPIGEDAQITIKPKRTLRASSAQLYPEFTLSAWAKNRQLHEKLGAIR